MYYLVEKDNGTWTECRSLRGAKVVATKYAYNRAYDGREAEIYRCLDTYPYTKSFVMSVPKRIYDKNGFYTLEY